MSLMVLGCSGLAAVTSRPVQQPWSSFLTALPNPLVFEIEYPPVSSAFPEYVQMERDFAEFENLSWF